MEKEEIGKKIKILRKTRGLTQQQLADKLSVKRATISNYEIGRRSPHIKELEEISEALGVSAQSVRIGLQRGALPFGSAIKTSSKYTYVIYEKKLKEFIDL